VHLLVISEFKLLEGSLYNTSCIIL